MLKPLQGEDVGYSDQVWFTTDYHLRRYVVPVLLLWAFLLPGADYSVKHLVFELGDDRYNPILLGSSKTA